jgi:hypothetical protein
MQVAHPHQPLSDVGCLQRRALGRRMGSEIARYGDEHASTRFDVAAFVELPDSGLQHLIRMEACIFAQDRVCERRDQGLRRMTTHAMSCHQPSRKIDPPLAIKCIEQ